MAKLFVICGHGAGDPGACAGGQREADNVRALARRMKALGGSSVTVGDTSRNWYRDNGIGRGHVPKGRAVIELHQDSGAASAKGGHVIYKKGLAPDAYDRALAAFVGEFFPGRSVKLSARSDLANVNRAAKMGVNYRLVELGFISNAGDRAKFRNQMDDLARGILRCFNVAPGLAPAPQPSGPIEVDGLWGSDTTLLAQRVCGTPADGEVWHQPGVHRHRLPGCTLGWKFDASGAGSPLMRKLQGIWGVEADGLMGPDTINAMIAYYMKKGSGATLLDGKLDRNSKTVKAFQRELNAGRI